jgi:hypothetical protein
VLIFYKILISILITFSVALDYCSASAETIDECEDEYQEYLAEILLEDKDGVLTDYLSLITLKLSYRFSQSRSEDLKDYIMKEVRRLAKLDKDQINEKIKKLYKRMGISDDYLQIHKLIELEREGELDLESWYFERYGSSVISFMATMEDCEGEHCLNEGDASVLWFYDKVLDKVYDENYDIELPHFSPFKIDILSSIEGNQFIPDKLNDLIQSLKEKLLFHYKDIKEAFGANSSNCYKLLFGDKCYQSSNDLTLEKQIETILNTLPLNQFALKSSEKLLFKINKEMQEDVARQLESERLTLREEAMNALEDPIQYTQELFTERLWERSFEKVVTCGNKTFKSGLSTRGTFSYYYSNKERLQGRDEKNKKLAKKLNGLCRLLEHTPLNCSTFVNTWIISLRHANKNVCCNEQETQSLLFRLTSTIYAGIEVQVALSELLLPATKVAGFHGGLLFGVGGVGTIGGSVSPNECSKNWCGDMVINANVYGGVFMEHSTFRTGVEAKVAWKPYWFSRMCWEPQNKLNMTSNLKLGSIWVLGRAYLGWVVTYDFRQMVYNSQDAHTFSFPIL